MSYRSSYGSGYSSSSFRRPYTPSYSSSYSPSYSTPSSSFSSSLYRPSTYSTFLSTYRRPSFGSSSYTPKRTNSSEDLSRTSSDEKYNSSNSEHLTGLRQSSFSRSLGNLNQANLDDDNLQDLKPSDGFRRTSDDLNYEKMYENEKSIRVSEQEAIIEDLEAQIELRKQIIAVFGQLTLLDEELEQEKERCDLLEKLQNLRDEHDRLVAQQQNSKKPQARTMVPSSRTALGSRRF